MTTTATIPAAPASRPLPATAADPGRDAPAGWRWWRPAIAVVAVMFGINVVTLSRSPAVWLDEAAFCDPAINFLLGRGLTSTVWPMQSAAETYVGNAPLYTYALVPWLKVFGVGVLAARSMNLVLIAAAATLTIAAARRAGLIRHPWVAALLAMAIHGGEGVSLSYRYGRYDSMGFLWFACAAWFACRPRGRLRDAGLFAACALLGPTGYQNLFGLIAFGAATLILTRRRYVRELILAFAGAGAGMLVYGAALAAAGLLPRAVEALTPLRDSYGGELPFVPRLAWALTNEKSTLILGAATLASAIGAAWVPAARRPVAAALVALSVPALVLTAAGRMPPYYAWFKFVPAAVALSWLLERLLSERRPPIAIRAWRASLVGALLLSSAAMLARAALAGIEWHVRDYAQVEAFVRSQVTPADVVFSQYTAYYVLVRDRRAFYPIYPMSDAERASVSLLLATPEEASAMLKRVGGDWIRVASFTAQGRSVSLPGLKGAPYRLDSYRRADAPHAEAGRVGTR